MAKTPVALKSVKKAARRAPSAKQKKGSKGPDVIQLILWRLDRLDRQVHTLSELVREHAEDADRLVRIVAEDRDALRRELLRLHQTRVRVRRHARAEADKVGLTN
jgi:hypothetical protein